MSSTSWRIPRESDEWVGPLTITADGQPITSGIEVAVLPKGQRPAAGNWRPPDPDPAGSAGIGVQVAAAAGPRQDGIWVRIDTTVVIEPDDVGWIFRT